MSLTTKDLQQIGQVVVDTTSPMFEMVFERIDKLDTRMDGLEGRMTGLEGRMDGLEGQMGRLEGRMSKLEGEFRNFKSSVHTRLSALEQRVAEIQAGAVDRFENVEEDIRLLYQLVHKLEHGSAKEKQFAEATIIKHLPTIHKAIVMIAKQHDIAL